MTICSAILTIALFMQTGPEPPTFTAKLYAAHESVAPGGQTDLLVEIEVADGWHIYNPIILDTGLATDVQFAAPAGVTIGDLRFPVPDFGEQVGLEYLEHTGKIRCVAPLRVGPDVPAGKSIPISAKITGLACIEACLPVETSASLTLPITAESGKPANEELFKEARAALAPEFSKAPFIEGSELRISKDKLGIDEPAELIAVVRVKEGHHIQDRDPGVDLVIPSRLFIEKVAGLEFAEADAQIWPKPRVHETPGIGKVREQAGEFQIRVPFKITDDEFPSGPVTVRVLFHYQCCIDAGSCFPPETAEGFVRFVADTPNAPAVVAAAPALVDSETPAAATADQPTVIGTTGTDLSLWGALIAGFIGGLILNIMPCVLPVISIKVLSFVQQAGEDPKRVFRLGLAFCAGIMVWFWLFAAASALGNIPMQSPAIVLGIATIMFVFALNLFGVFEIVLPGAAAGKLDEAAQREGYLGSFFKGLLATLLGTACTAPFLISALAYTATTPFAFDLMVYSAAGLGMSSPYLLLTAKPGWLKYVPKPGMWMITFKQAMGFVLVGTAIWLLSILNGLLSSEGVVWTVSFWGFLGLAVWLIGKISLTWSAGRRLVTWTAAVAVVLVGWWFSFSVMSDWEDLTAPEVVQRAVHDPAELAERVRQANWDEGIPWQKWWPEAGPEIAAAGFTAYIDYTAKWCLTCQANKKLFLETDPVRSHLRELGVIPIKADFTKKNPTMAEEIKKFIGKEQVPLNLVYPAGKPAAVIQLPAQLTSGIVMEALDKAGPSDTGAESALAEPDGGAGGSAGETRRESRS